MYSALILIIFNSELPCMKNLLFLFCFAIHATQLIGQIAEEIPEPPYIKTVQFNGGSQLGQLPILKLGASLNLSFDDIIGDERDYYYKITHYNADWTPSDLAKSEYP